VGSALRLAPEMIQQVVGAPLGSRHVIHDQEILPVGAPQVMHLHDVSVVEISHHASFRAETPNEALVIGQGLGEDLDGILLAHERVTRPVDAPHAPFA